MTTAHFRTTPATVTGRTLEGVALYFERASKVTDDGRKFYPEAFERRSVDKTLRERAVRPLGYFHPWTPGSPGSKLADARPLGSARFSVGSHDGAPALLFEASIARTRAGDEMLELVELEAVGDVSVGFNAYQSRTRAGVVWRTEIGLRELSLAPSGYGQHAGAEVLAMRAEQLPAAGTPRLDALRRRRSLLVDI